MNKVTFEIQVKEPGYGAVIYTGAKMQKDETKAEMMQRYMDDHRFLFVVSEDIVLEATARVER